jgi:1,5-anhydro-D-fructose reductase (1,5-anhydro-D-mannitol-forming)
LRTIRWGIIGCGDVTEVKSGPGFQKADNSKLVAVMRRNGDLAKDYARRHNVPKWYDHAEELINDHEVDAIYIATPPSVHKEYTLQAARAGKPVYVEKPMALNTDECRIMIDACRDAGVPLFVAYYRRALQRFLKIKELIDAQAIGTVRFVQITFYQPYAMPSVAELPWRLQPKISGGGHFVDLASHMLDFLDFILEPIESVHGFASNHLHMYPAEDIVSGAFKFRSQVHGTGTWCFSGFKKFDCTEIIGDRGKISYSTFDAQPIRLTTQNDVVEFSIEYPPHIQQPLIQIIVDELNGLGKCPSTGETALRTTWVMEQMLKNYYASSAE